MRREDVFAQPGKFWVGDDVEEELGRRGQGWSRVLAEGDAQVDDADEDDEYYNGDYYGEAGDG